MPRSTDILFHLSFQEQVEGVCGTNQKLIKALTTALQKIAGDPTCGKMMRDAPENLAGKLRRLQVSGRRGHRLIYLYVAGNNVAIPVYFSEEPKSTFDYDDVDWEGISETFYDDYVNKRYARFRNFSP